MDRKRAFVPKRTAGQDVALQITSMADIFTILLVFLLKSFAGGDLTISPTQGLQLPVAATEATSAPALTIEISESAVQVENKFIDGLSRFHFDTKDLLASGIPNRLNEELDKQRKRQDLIAKSNSDVKPDSKLLVVADQRTPYITLKRVISTAALHGFNEPKLVVMVRD